MEIEMETEVEMEMEIACEIIYVKKMSARKLSFGIQQKLLHSELASSDDSRNRCHCHYSHVTSS